jgi:hypothetical protein
MSLIATAERLAMSWLPPKVTKSLQDLKQRLPLRLMQAPPVVQMYLNDSHTQSFVGLHNFYSCLLPEVDTAAQVELRFYSPAGKPIARTALELRHFAARAVDVKALLDRNNIDSPHGVVTAQITPRAPRRRVYRELGEVSAQFFVFFRDRDAGAVEQTHPLSTTDPRSQPSPPFCSSQILSTDKLRRLIAFQYNPTPRPHTLEHSLVDAQTGEPVARQTLQLSGLGSARSVFELSELGRLPSQLLFCVDALPSANSKPMLRRVFDGGLHSMSHA